MANPVSGIFQTFQEDLGSWLNKGNRKEQLDNVAKNVTGISNVKVKDPALFTRFLQETTPPPPPQPQPQQEPLPPAYNPPTSIVVPCIPVALSISSFKLAND